MTERGELRPLPGARRHRAAGLDRASGSPTTAATGTSTTSRCCRSRSSSRIRPCGWRRPSPDAIDVVRRAGPHDPAWTPTPPTPRSAASAASTTSAGIAAGHGDRAGRDVADGPAPGRGAHRRRGRGGRPPGRDLDRGRLRQPRQTVDRVADATEAGPPGDQADPVQRYVDEVIIWGSPARVADKLAELGETIDLRYLMMRPAQPLDASRCSPTRSCPRLLLTAADAAGGISTTAVVLLDCRS